MKSIYFSILAALLVLAPLGLQAGEATQASPEKEAVATTYDTWSAKVTNIDTATHTLTLLNGLGETQKVQVDPAKVRNFAQIKKGDLVVIRSTQQLALTLTKKQKGQEPSAGAALTMDRAPAGAKPGMETGKAAEISAEVVKVDKKAQTVKLKGPEGNMVELRVQNPAQMENLQKGDMVAATYTQATAISVEPQPAAPGK